MTAAEARSGAFNSLDEARLPICLLAGRLNREYVLLPKSSPRIDTCGGSLAYAAGGFAVWQSGAALLARVAADYPAAWLLDLAARGFDVRGISVQATAIDLREFVAYTDDFERSSEDPVSHFSRRGITFPKSLLGYRGGPAARSGLRESDRLSLVPSDIPPEFRAIRHVHLCPLDLPSHVGLLGAIGGGEGGLLSAEPQGALLSRSTGRDLAVLLRGVTALHTTEADLRRLFWGKTNDLWEMTAAVSAHGPTIVVVKRGAQGHSLYDAAAKARWEVPAYPSRVADPTGAGDAFSGGFMAGMHMTGDALEAVLRGSVSASLKLEGSGPFYPLQTAPGLAEARLRSLRSLVSAV